MPKSINITRLNYQFPEPVHITKLTGNKLTKKKDRDN